MGHDRHLVVDGNFLLHTSIPYSPDDAVGPHRSSYNFLKRIANTAEALSATRISVCWDAGIPARRRQLCPEYKKNREVKNNKDRTRHEDFARNRDFIRSVLPFFAVRQLVYEGMEADDLIYGIATLNRGYTHIYSGDMDLLQLVSSTVTLHRGRDKTSIRLETLGSYVLDKNYDIRPTAPRDIVGFKALRGDPSDNIPPICKPRSVCQMWPHRGDSSLPALKQAASRVGVEIPASIDDRYSVVDLARSGVAADAISLAVVAAGSTVRLHEDEIIKKFVEVGIVPGYIHSMIPSFQVLQ